MDTTHDFLDLLGLDGNARERDIRGAYARRLKRIDQEQDPEAFQRLRAAYETALDWAAWKTHEQQREQPAPDADAAIPPASPAPAAPAQPPQPEPPTPGELAHAVFERLAAELPGLAAQAQGSSDPLPWKNALLRRLDDDELINIDARITFEAWIATILAQGWQPGHEHLFVAAQEVFGWNDDRRSLLQFGQAGALLDQALAERALLDAMPVEQLRALRTTLQALRRPDAPDARQLRAGIRNVELLAEHFPALARVIVSIDNIEHWRTAYRTVAGKPLEPEHALPPPPSPAGWTFGKIVRALLMILAASVLLNILDKAIDDKPSRNPAPVSQAILDTLIGPIEFKPSPEAKPGTLDTRVRVFLGEDMQVKRVQNIATSGEPAFDRAVGEAVQAAKPFPPGTPAEFELSFTAQITRSTPREAVQPLDFKRLAQSSSGEPPDGALLGKHIPPVDYTPTRFAKPGTRYSLRYEVFLDADGKVERVEQRQASGAPRLDRAFEDALRAARPFPATTARRFEVSWSTTITAREAAPPRKEEAQPHDASPDNEEAPPQQP